LNLFSLNPDTYIKYKDTIEMPRTRKSHHRRGGAMLHPAPTNYSLAGSQASTTSLGQGRDYLNYHTGQHGGRRRRNRGGCGLNGAPLTAITDSVLPGNLVGPAGLNSLGVAFNEIKGLSDQAGGRRRRRTRRGSKRGKQSRKAKHTKKHGRRSRRHRKRGGAELEYAPFPSQGMLLDDYSKAGLNFDNSVENFAAMNRQAM